MSGIAMHSPLTSSNRDDDDAVPVASAPADPWGGFGVGVLVRDRHGRPRSLVLVRAEASAPGTFGGSLMFAYRGPTAARVSLTVGSPSQYRVVRTIDVDELPPGRALRLQLVMVRHGDHVRVSVTDHHSGRQYGLAVWFDGR
jgi:hypothetical protein